jgi:1,4-dihydroxy-2-naphthoate polyprenyltransferase
LVSYLAGVFILGWVGSAIDLFLICVSVALLQVAINIQNDVEDHVGLVDRPGDIGGSGVIQKGWFTARQLQRGSRVVLFAAILAGAWPVYQQWQVLLPFGAVSGLLAYSYSGIGVRFKAKALGDFVVFLLCGPMLTLGASLALFGRIHPLIVGLGVVFGLGAVGILHANNLNDLEIDRDRGAKTVANQIGFQGSKVYLAAVYALMGVALAALFVWTEAPVWFCVAPLVTSIPIAMMLKRVFEASGPLSEKISKIRFEAAQIHLLVGIAWMVGFGVSHYFKLGVGM